jgi:DNA-binding SARP family transcriptional activator
VVLRLQLLDGFYLEADGREQVLSASSRRLVAHLALRGRPSRASVAGQLWPEVSEEHAHGSLRAALHRLQAACPRVVRYASGALWLDDVIQVDVREVTRWAHRMISRDGDFDAAPAPPSTYASELLPGWYEEWVLQEREQFRQLRLHALEVLCDRLAAAGCFGEALYAGHSALREEPLRESAHRAVIRVHLAEGNLVEALRQFQRYREHLRAEIGIEPTKLITDLFNGYSVHLISPAEENEARRRKEPGSPQECGRGGGRAVTQ